MIAPIRKLFAAVDEGEITTSVWLVLDESRDTVKKDAARAGGTAVEIVPASKMTRSIRTERERALIFIPKNLDLQLTRQIKDLWEINRLFHTLDKPEWSRDIWSDPTRSPNTGFYVTKGARRTWTPIVPMNHAKFTKWV